MLVLVLVAVFPDVDVDACDVMPVPEVPVESVDVVLGGVSSLLDEQAAAIGTATTVNETRLRNFMSEPEEAWQSFARQARERSHKPTRNSESAVNSFQSKVFPDQGMNRS